MNEDLRDLYRKHIGHNGKMISGSKSGYRDKYPKNLVVFNSNICTAKGKDWFGDIDITLEREALKNLASELGETVYVLYEMDGRFEHEGKPLIEKFVYKVDPSGNETLGERESAYYESETLIRKS